MKIIAILDQLDAKSRDRYETALKSLLELCRITSHSNSVNRKLVQEIVEKALEED